MYENLSFYFEFFHKQSRKLLKKLNKKLTKCHAKRYVGRQNKNSFFFQFSSQLSLCLVAGNRKNAYTNRVNKSDENWRLIRLFVICHHWNSLFDCPSTYFQLKRMESVCKLVRPLFHIHSNRLESINRMVVHANTVCVQFCLHRMLLTHKQYIIFYRIMSISHEYISFK